ncbi:hypothetical protein CIPAW_13G114800 [Carya illinoinensis]|uniref:Uncharacterized protein n=1 Tax=Carya illinoinensis TaxID=32201 RepID=A0A8T1NRI4_CARIL|nr:hypothetical protein CIPAW_13G114800 [Carya illinoinensis]
MGFWVCGQKWVSGFMGKNGFLGGIEGEAVELRRGGRQRRACTHGLSEIRVGESRSTGRETESLDRDYGPFVAGGGAAAEEAVELGTRERNDSGVKREGDMWDREKPRERGLVGLASDRGGGR